MNPYSNGDDRHVVVRVRVYNTRVLELETARHDQCGGVTEKTRLVTCDIMCHSHAGSNCRGQAWQLQGRPSTSHESCKFPLCQKSTFVPEFRGLFS